MHPAAGYTISGLPVRHRGLIDRFSLQADATTLGEPGRCDVIGVRTVSNLHRLADNDVLSPAPPLSGRLPRNRTIVQRNDHAVPDRMAGLQRRPWLLLFRSRGARELRVLRHDLRRSECVRTLARAKLPRICTDATRDTGNCGCRIAHPGRGRDTSPHPHQFQSDSGST